MYLCSYKDDYHINGRKLYDELHINDLKSFPEFYIEVENVVFDKVGNSASELDFWLSLLDAISICKHYLPERNAKRVLLKLQRYRRRQLKEIESGYYEFRDRIVELEAELTEQKKLTEAARSDAEKSELADIFLRSNSCVTAKELNVILRQDGIIKTYPSTVFETMERFEWIDNSGAVKHMPTPYGIDKGYVRLEQDIKNSRKWQYAPLVITAKGQAELLEHFKELNEKAVASNENACKT